MVTRLGLLVIIALFNAPVIRAQSPSTDPILELLIEVRGLRAALERSASIGARVQLFVARIQLQEQRIAELSHRGASVRSELRSADLDIVNANAAVKGMEESLSRISAEDRANAEHEISQLKVRLGVIERRRQELASEETQLAQEMGLEQGRWVAINDQLEQFERSLAILQPKQ